MDTQNCESLKYSHRLGGLPAAPFIDRLFSRILGNQRLAWRCQVQKFQQQSFGTGVLDNGRELSADPCAH